MPPEPPPHRPSVDGPTLKRFATLAPAALLALLGMLAGWGLVPWSAGPAAASASLVLETPTLDAGANSPSSDSLSPSPHERSDVLDVELREPEIGEDEAGPKRFVSVGRLPSLMPQGELRDRDVIDETVTRFAARSRRDARGADHRATATSRGPPLAG